jgi:hypothetical protein
VRSGLILILLVASVSPGLADDGRTSRAHREIEQQLKEMVKLPAASVEIVFDGIDSSRYQLLEASFELDGESLPKKIPAGRAGGPTLLFAGDLLPGSHTVAARLVYEQAGGASIFDDGNGTKFRVPGKFIFSAQRGLFVRVHTRVEVDDGAELPKRLQLAGNADVDLRAQLEDGNLPAPPEKPKPAPLEKPKPAAPEETADSVSVAQPSSVAPEAPRSIQAPSRKRRHRDGNVKLARAEAAATGPRQAVDVSAVAKVAPEPTSADRRPMVATADAGAESPSARATPVETVAVAVASAPPMNSVASLPADAAQPEERSNIGGFTPLRLGIGLGVIALVAVLVFAVARRRS